MKTSKRFILVLLALLLFVSPASVFAQGKKKKKPGELVEYSFSSRQRGSTWFILGDVKRGDVPLLDIQVSDAAAQPAGLVFQSRIGGLPDIHRLEV